jgi:small multidrug resistance pump
MIERIAMRAGLDPQSIVERHAWPLLAVAVLAEIAGVLGLRLSAGFERPTPGILALLAFTVALVLVSRVMRRLPVSVAYPVWAGGGTAGVAALGMLFLQEPVTPAGLAGIGLVVSGVVLINRTTEKRCGC